jgi:flagellar hook-associated protein 3 FlgL
MRISTSSVYQTAVNSFNNMQSAIASSIEQVDSGIALTNPSDNPAAAAQVLNLTQTGSINTQLGVNRTNANNSLAMADSALSGVTNQLQSLESKIVQAGDGTLSNSDRATVATGLKSSLDQLVGLANSTDQNGNYLFAGYSSSTAPYTETPGGATYNGDQGQRTVQVDTAQNVALSDVGSNIFGNIATSTSSFFGTVNANNTSTATFSAGTVSNAAALTGNNYSINFTSASSYNVTNTTTGATVSTANTYTSGSPITFDGISISVSDGTTATAPATTAPAAGDAFAVQSGNQSIFQTLNDAITALNQPVTTAGDHTNLANSLAQANANIQKSLSNVLTARAGFGDSMQQITNLNSVGSSESLNNASAISTLQNTDYAQAISQLSLEQFTYQAAQKAFASTSQMSLMSMLP